MGTMIQGIILCMVFTCMTFLATLPPILFSIGQEDHSPAEFALGSGYGWQ
jgi:ABC-type sulfate transport system permease subunit